LIVLVTATGKTDERLLKEIGGYLKQDPKLSVNSLAAKAQCHYTVARRVVEELKAKGLLPKPEEAAPTVQLPEPISLVTYNFKPKSGFIRLVPVTDTHIGAPKDGVDWPKLKGMISYIVNTPDTYAVGLGDYTDGMIHGFTTDRGHPSPWECSHNPTKQIALLFDEVFLPLAKAGKFLGYLMGDHDGWLLADRGLDMDSLLSKFLNLTSTSKVPYLTDGFWMNLKVDDYLYTVYARHGMGSGTTDSGRRSTVSRQFERVNADVKLTGHHHIIDAWKTPYMDNGVIRKSYIVMCGTMLRYQGTYAENWGLHPGVTGFAKIKFYGKEHERDCHVTI
jgi:hypothetical protein